MKKGRANMEIQTIIKVLRLKIQSLKESGERNVHSDLLAFSQAKVALLEDLVALAPTYSGLRDFHQAIDDEIVEVGVSLRLSRNPFIVAAMKVKSGILREVQALIPAHDSEINHVPRKNPQFVLV